MRVTAQTCTPSSRRGWSAAAAAAHHLTVRPRSVAAGFDLLSQQVAAKHSQSLRSTNITSPEKRGSFCRCRASLTVAMLSLSRLANALAPGSARLFSAAAAGENSFKLNKKDNTVTWTLSPVKYHLLTEKMPTEVTTTRDEALKYFKEMSLMRRMELVADMMYKGQSIRGFCHLYDGQEAITSGMEAVLSKEDYLITAYRDHCTQLGRGDTVKRVLAELTGRATGCSKGKGGSMHMYLRSANFFGGNGIVGAQCAVGTGLALAAKYHEHGNMKIGAVPCKHVSVTMFGDGASNQGQLYESMNMAGLWSLPVIYILENNQFGMGTSKKRHAHNSEFYSRYDSIPGLRCDGMDVFAVREAMALAKRHCTSGQGPILLELDTYRYHGHSMSDPGISYRSREDIANVRAKRDPIERIRKILLETGLASEAELKEIEKAIKIEVEEAKVFAESSPWPAIEELYTEVETPNPEYIRGIESEPAGYGKRPY